MQPGIILYGPPASGKDTVSAALTRRDGRYAHYRRLKVGTGRTAGYRLGTTDDLARLRTESAVLYENSRYQSIYVVDRPELDSQFRAGSVPVVQVGQVAAVTAIRRYPAVWLGVLLWCDREVAHQRIIQRGDRDIAARLTAWDETLTDLATAGPGDFQVRVSTDEHDPDEAAEIIDSAVRRNHAAGPVDAP